MTWELVSISEVQSIYNISESDIKDEWYDFAESLLLKHLGEETVTDITNTTGFTETVSGTGEKIILLTHPVETLNSIKIKYTNSAEAVQTAEVDVSEVSVYGKELVWDTSEFPEGRRNIVVNYDALIPNTKTYRFVMATMVAAIGNYEGRKGSDRSMKWSDIPREWGSETSNEAKGLVGNLKSILHEFLPRERRVYMR